MKKEKPVILFDMDGVLCDYPRQLKKDMKKIAGPEEKHIFKIHDRSAPKYIKQREQLIKSRAQWWADLPIYQPGWDLLKAARKIGYRIMILSKMSSSNPTASAAGKRRWIEKHLGTTADVTFGDDKGLVYGRVLVDDYPEFLLKWLAHRPRGLAIMPLNSSNRDFHHPQVLRYNGKNLARVKKLLKESYARQSVS
jgi:hypothetical protein